MTWTYCAIGTTLANLVNIESLLTFDTIYIPEDGRVPLVGGVNKRVNGVLKRDGFANGKWITTAEQEEFNAFLLSIFGSYTLSSKKLYVSTVDESNHFSPFRCNFERPSTADQSAPPAGNGAYLSPVTFNLTDCILQAVSKTANYSRTTSDRLINYDTTSGNITDALPAAATVTPDTIYTAIKTAAANTLTINPDGSEQIQNASTLALTALYARADFYSDGTAWHTI